MTSMLQDFVRSPDLHFGTPAEVLESIDFTDAEKLKLLSSWKNDLIELQHASEENMNARDDESNGSADILGQVLAAINMLERRQAAFEDD
jgi:hypothetical protein